VSGWLKSIVIMLTFGLSGFTYSPVDIELKGQYRTAAMNNGVITVDVSKGANPVMQYRSPRITSKCPSSMLLQAEFEFSENYHFAKRIEKLPLGIYGGEGHCISGGCPLDLRDGYSIRLIEKGGKPGLYIYDEMPGISGNDKDYGRVIYSEFTFRAKKRYEIIVGLDYKNAVLIVDGDKLIEESLYLKKNEWCASGILMTFMWGGPADEQSHWAPKEQSFNVSEVVLNVN
jgi:hypothetical protein